MKTYTVLMKYQNLFIRTRTDRRRGTVTVQIRRSSNETKAKEPFYQIQVKSSDASRFSSTPLPCRRDHRSTKRGDYPGISLPRDELLRPLTPRSPPVARTDVPRAQQRRPHETINTHINIIIQSYLYPPWTRTDETL